MTQLYLTLSKDLEEWIHVGFSLFLLFVNKKNPSFIFNAATLHLYYLLYSNCFTWFHLKDKNRNIDYFFFFCLFPFLSFLPIVSYAQTMNMLMHVCRYVRWQSGGREQLAGPHSTTYWPVLHSPVIQPNVSTWLCCSWATINLTVRAREGSLE